MTYNKRRLVGFLISFLLGVLVTVVYRFTHVNEWILLFSTAALIIVILVPWIVEGEFIWNLKRADDA